MFRLSFHRTAVVIALDTDGKIHITTAQPEGKAHGQLCLRITCINESAASVISLKPVMVSFPRLPFRESEPDIRRPLPWRFQVRPSSEVLSFKPQGGDE